MSTSLSYTFSEPPNVITLGCSKNVYDSEVLMGQLRASGKDVTHEAPAHEEGNIIV
ncbi:MAG: hypothetical protein DI548_11230, partial [Flavobacterium johnsoniae]